MKTIPFDLEKCRAAGGWCVTRDGRRAKVLAFEDPFDPNAPYPLSVRIEKYGPARLTSQGLISCGVSSLDLVLPAPAPKRRPFKPTEIPFGKLLRIGKSKWSLILAYDPFDDLLSVGAVAGAFTSHFLMSHPEVEWSPDNGVTWLPWGMEEEAENENENENEKDKERP